MSNIINHILNRIDPISKNRTRNKMLIAAWIDDKIKENGWSKSEFAEKVGISDERLNEWLSGTYNFSIDEFSDVCFVFRSNFVLERDSRDPYLNGFDNSIPMYFAPFIDVWDNEDDKIWDEQ